MKSTSLCILTVWALAISILVTASHSDSPAAGPHVATGTAWPLAGGILVTSHHVVADHDDVLLVTRTGEEIEATVVLRDESDDIALMVARNPEKLPRALPISDKPVKLGASVFTIGYPRADVMGVSPKLTEGVISSVNGLQDDPGSFQITVPIQPGNSGGPLVNMSGEVVGVVSTMLVVAHSDGQRVFTNINYAVKIGVVKDLLEVFPDQHEHPVREIIHASDSLEDLAMQIQDSVLMVQAR